MFCYTSLRLLNKMCVLLSIDINKDDFNELYRQINGMDLRKMDRIIYPVCLLCRIHQRSGFVERVKLRTRHKRELSLR